MSYPIDTAPHSGPKLSAPIAGSQRPQRLSRGARLGLNLEIDELVARGGMAEIYRARHTSWNKFVAVKVLQQKNDAKDREHILTGLQLEGKLLADLPDIQNVVRVYDSAVDPNTGLFFVVMELLEGKNLREYLILRHNRGEPLSPREAVTITLTIANTLHQIHKLNYYHRDLKPENVFIQRSNGKTPAHIKLLDLGAAIAPSEQQLRTEGTETRTIGTPLYMSPEQTMRGVITARSDIFSLGMMLYEMVRGTHPYADRELPKEDEVSAMSNLYQVDPPPRLSDCVPGVLPELDELVGRMMATDPDRRYGSAKEVAGALASFLARHKGRLGGSANEKDMFQEAIINAPRSALDAAPASGAGATPVLGVTKLAAPNVPQTLRGGAPEQAPPTAPLPTPRMHGSTPPEPAKGTMRIEIGKRGQTPGAIASVLKIEKFTSPDEQPGPDGVQAGMLRELLVRLPPASAVLEVDSFIVTEGPARLIGLRYPIEFLALKVGRAREANVIVPHVTVSRMHCGVFAITEGVYEVVDTRSSYGIEVNDIPTQRAMLRGRARLRVGDVTLQMVPARTHPPDLRNSKVFNSVSQDPSIAAYASAAVLGAGGFSRATVPSSRDRQRFQRAATQVRAPGLEVLGHAATTPSFAIPAATAAAAKDAPAPSRPLDPTKKMDIVAFKPGPNADQRGGTSPWRRTEARLTHEYFEPDKFPPALKSELERGNKASMEHLLTEQPTLTAARLTGRLADCLFMINEHAARLALLAGQPGGLVYQARLADARDWDGIAKSIVENVVAQEAREKRRRTRTIAAVVVSLLVGLGVLGYFTLRAI